MSKCHFPGGIIYLSAAGVAWICVRGTCEQTLSKKTACEVILKNLQLLPDFSAKVQLLVENVEINSAALAVSHEMLICIIHPEGYVQVCGNRTTTIRVLKLIA